MYFCFLSFPHADSWGEEVCFESEDGVPSSIYDSSLNQELIADHEFRFSKGKDLFRKIMRIAQLQSHYGTVTVLYGVGSQVVLSLFLIKHSDTLKRDTASWWIDLFCSIKCVL